jgi:hypothetical protein
VITTVVPTGCEHTETVAKPDPSGGTQRVTEYVGVASNDVMYQAARSIN